MKKWLEKLAKSICIREGKKKQVSIGNAREIVGILSDMFYEYDGHEMAEMLIKNGERRAKKGNK